jgi:hypothetical protein
MTQPGLGQGRQLEGVQFVEGRGGEHRASLLVVVPAADLLVDGSQGGARPARAGAAGRARGRE